MKRTHHNISINFFTSHKLLYNVPTVIGVSYQCRSQNLINQGSSTLGCATVC